MKALALIAALVATPVLAQEGPFSEGSEARTWNLAWEVPARFEAQVVDILCELTGDCPDNCGNGTRQLGLLRQADDVLVFPNKNGQPAFTGAVEELLPYCGQMVEVDGLMIDDEYVGAVNIYQLQMIRALDEDDFTSANRWTQVWAEENPDAAGSGPWFRRDPRVLEQLGLEGYFGLGLEEDQIALEELFP